MKRKWFDKKVLICGLSKSGIAAAEYLNSKGYIVVGDDLTTLINQLTEGPNASGISITVPEGYTIKRIAAAVEESLGISADDFIAQAKVSNYKSEYSFLEGADDDASLVDIQETGLNALGGQDLQGTRLWWDIDQANF